MDYIWNGGTVAANSLTQITMDANFFAGKSGNGAAARHIIRTAATGQERRHAMTRHITARGSGPAGTSMLVSAAHATDLTNFYSAASTFLGDSTHCYNATLALLSVLEESGNAPKMFGTPQATPTPLGGDIFDNCEDGDNVDLWGGYWYTYDDRDTVNKGDSYVVPWTQAYAATMGKTPPTFAMMAPGIAPGSMAYGARMTGNVTTTYTYGFVGMGAGTNFDSGSPDFAVTDVSMYTGMYIYIKSNSAVNKLDVKLKCAASVTNTASNDYKYTYTGTTYTAYVTLPFSVFTQATGWGITVSQALVLKNLTDVQFQTSTQPMAGMDFEVDDIMFYPAKTPTPSPTYCAGQLVDNCEDGDNVNIFGGFWSSYKDTTAITTIWPSSVTYTPFVMSAPGANASLYCARITGTVMGNTTTATFVGMSTNMLPLTYTARNMSVFVGLTFWVKGDNHQYSVKLMPGTAVNDGQNDYKYTFTPPLSGGWQQMNISFSSFTQEHGWGTVVTLASVLQNLLSLHWECKGPGTLSGNHTYDLSVDDVAFECSQGWTPTATVTLTPTPLTGTNTYTPTSTRTASPTSSGTPTVTQTYTRTATPTGTFTPLPATSTYTSTATFTRTSTPTGTTTFTGTPSGTPTFTRTATGTFTSTLTQTPTLTFTPSSSATGSPTFTRTVTPTFTFTQPAATNTFTGTSTLTGTPTFTRTGTPTYTLTATSTASATQSASPTNSATRTGTPTFTGTVTNTSTNTPGNTSTFTPTQTYTSTRTGTPTFTGTATMSFTPTRTNTGTFTNTETGTPSSTLTRTDTPTMTGTPTYTGTATPTYTRTATGTYTTTLTSTPTLTISPTWTNGYGTLTDTPTITPTWTNSATPTFTGTPTITQTFTRTGTPTFTGTATPTYSETVSSTATGTPSFTPTRTGTPTYTGTFTVTSTNTPGNTMTYTATQTSTLTRTGTPTFTGTDSPTLTQTYTFTRTGTPTFTATNTPTLTSTPTYTRTQTPTYTSTLTGSPSPTISDTWTPGFGTSTDTPTMTQSWTSSASPTRTATDTVTYTRTPTFTQTWTGTDTPSPTGTNVINTATNTPTETNAINTATMTDTAVPPSATMTDTVALPTETATISTVPSMAVNFNVPPTVVVGEQLTVILSVLNNGTADLPNVSPGSINKSGTAGLTLLSGPAPVSDPVLAMGDTVDFTWIYNVVSPGTAAFQDGANSDLTTAGPITSSTVDCQNPTPTNTPIIPTATDTVTIPTATATAVLNPSMALAISVPMTAEVGQVLTVILTVTNNGTEDLTTVWPTGMTIGGTANIQGATSPTTPVSLAMGSSVSFTWTYDVLGAGTASFTVAGHSDQATAPPITSSNVDCPNPTPTNTPVIPTATFTATFTRTYTPTMTRTSTPMAPTATFTPTVEATSGTEQITGLVPYPNPFIDNEKNTLYIDFNISQTTGVSEIGIRIYTQAYRRILAVSYTGNNAVNVMAQRKIAITGDSLANLANGTYYYYVYVVQEGKEVRSKVDKVIILR